MFSLNYNLTQLTADQEIMNNLQASEEQLGNLNNQLDVIRMDYASLVSEASSYSFFNLNNIYFWFLIIGLLILALGLAFLWHELSHYSSESNGTKESLESEGIPEADNQATSITYNNQGVTEAPEEFLPEAEADFQPEVAVSPDIKQKQKNIKKAKAIKIKVVKVK